MEENFPIVTLTLVFLMILVFLIFNVIVNPSKDLPLELNQTYLEEFGFSPANFTAHPYTLVTYSFLHADIFHLVGNISMLLGVGIIAESVLKKFYFLATFLVSSNTAVIFFIASFKLIPQLQAGYLIGASGGIFGLLAVAAIARPMDGIPIALAIVSFFPFLPLVFPSLPFTTYLVVFAITVGVMLGFFPYFIPVAFAFVVFFLSILFELILTPEVSISYLGHFGGILGGIISFYGFLVGKPKRNYPTLKELGIK